MIDYDYYMEQRVGPQPPEENDWEEDEPMLTQCTDTESGGVQCEVMLTSPDEEHSHWISEATISRHVARPFLTVIDMGCGR